MTPKASSALILYNHICNFVYGERQGSNFIILYVAIPVLPVRFVEDFSFPHCTVLALLVKINCPQIYGFLYLDFQFYSTDYMSILHHCHTVLNSVAL